MVLYLCVLIVFSFHRESLKLILMTNPSPRWFCHIHGLYPWATTHPPNMVEGTHSQRGGWVMEMQSSPARSMTPELNGGEGGGPVARGVASSSGGALGPVHREVKGVSRAVHGSHYEENRGEDDKLTRPDRKPTAWTECKARGVLL
jgi:hypothetical protein